jgi:hypothetical protein
MSEPVTWAAVGMAAVSNMATWLVILKGKNGSKRAIGRNDKPCVDHEKRLTIVETNEKNRDKSIEKFMQENREDHQKFYAKLEELG